MKISGPVMLDGKGPYQLQGEVTEIVAVPQPAPAPVPTPTPTLPTVKRHPFDGISPLRTVTVAPGQSIQAALAAAKPGDEILVKPGTYTENLNGSGKKGTPSAPIWLRSETPGAAKIVPANTTKDTIRLGGAENVVVQGFDVKCPGSGRVGIFGCQATSDFSQISKNLVVIGNTVHDSTDDCIKMAQVDGAYVLDNLCRNAPDQAIDFVSVWGGVIAGNVCENVTGNVVIQVKGGSKDVLVEGNTIAGSSGEGINVGGGTDLAGIVRPDPELGGKIPDFEARRVTVRRNTISACKGRAVNCIGAADSVIEDNLAKSMPGASMVNIEAATYAGIKGPSRNLAIRRNVWPPDKTGWLRGTCAGLVIEGNVPEK